jgi:hypothetical protein
MKKRTFYMLLVFLALGCDGEVGKGSKPVRERRHIEPDQIVRLSPEKVFQKAKSGEAILVCAYENEVAFRAAKLQGAISYEQFTATLASMDVKREIIFYCA